MIGYRFIGDAELANIKQFGIVYGRCNTNGKNNSFNNDHQVYFYTGKIYIDGKCYMGLPCWHGKYLVVVDIPDDMITLGLGQYYGITAHEFITQYYTIANIISIYANPDDILNDICIISDNDDLDVIRFYDINTIL